MSSTPHFETRLGERAAIADLMAGWMWRDIGDWERLQALFHPGATLNLSWFRGSATEFLAASRKMAQASAYLSKHFVGTPLMRFAGDRALVETNVAMYIESRELRLGVEQHFRFIDRMSTQRGRWGIEHRDAVYDMGWFIYPQGPALADAIDAELLKQQPEAYAAMAYLNARNGHPLEQVAATRGSALEAEIRQRGDAWLAEGSTPG